MVSSSSSFSLLNAIVCSKIIHALVAVVGIALIIMLDELKSDTIIIVLVLG